MLVYEETAFFKLKCSWLKGLLRVFFSLLYLPTQLGISIVIMYQRLYQCVCGPLRESTDCKEKKIKHNNTVNHTDW
jgi:hypothetical protein